MRFVSGVHLERREQNADRIAALTARHGRRVGVAGVLEHLNREAHRSRVPGRAPVRGFSWNHQDADSTAWWPQGITTTSDASADGEVDGHRLVVVSWYSQLGGEQNQGSRLTFVDLRTLRYRHVLVVRAGRHGPEPLRIHAGGVVWAGDRLHLAGTARGLFTCHVDDVLHVPPGEATFGYRYVLPVREAYRASHDDGVTALRYSFLSLDRDPTGHGDPPQLLAGEYGTGGQTTRFVRYPLDADTLDLRRDEEGLSRPVFLHDGGVGHMQGSAVVHGRYHVTVSRGRRHRGHLYVGSPGDLRPVRWALPPGPEDISYWPQTDELWSLSEWPGQRWVFAMDRSRLRRWRLRSPGWAAG